MFYVGNDWDELLRDELSKPYFAQLADYVKHEYDTATVYPPRDKIFEAFRLTPYKAVKVVILGQDPYHEPGQAHGLAFSVPRGTQYPPSLQNIFKELDSDIALRKPKEDGAGVLQEAGERSQEAGERLQEAGERSQEAGENLQTVGEISRKRGVLEHWAEQGVLLLNTVLTVRAHEAGSHRGRGWEQFTDRVIELLAERHDPIVFILWGAPAGKKKEIILRASEGTGTKHLIITAPHPSPLSAYRGFFGGRYFSRANYFLDDNGKDKIEW